MIEALYEKVNKVYFDKMSYLNYLNEIRVEIDKLRINQETYIDIDRKYKDNIITVEEILFDVSLGLNESNEKIAQSYFKRAYDMITIKCKFTGMYRRPETFKDGVSGRL